MTTRRGIQQKWTEIEKKNHLHLPGNQRVLENTGQHAMLLTDNEMYPHYGNVAFGEFNRKAFHLRCYLDVSIYVPIDSILLNDDTSWSASTIIVIGWAAQHMVIASFDLPVPSRTTRTPTSATSRPLLPPHSPTTFVKTCWQIRVHYY